MTQFPDPPPADAGPAAGGYPQPERPPGDPLGMAAIVVGCIGLVFFGIVLALVTAVLAGIAGQRARERRASLENAYIAFVLAGLDGVVWLILHMLFGLSFLAG
jgi:hypothetical protein